MHETLRDEVNAQGDPIIAAWIDASPRRINGKPMVLSFEAPDSAVSTNFVALGDPRKLMWGNHIALEIKLFDATVHAVEYTEIFFRCRRSVRVLPLEDRRVNLALLLFVREELDVSWIQSRADAKSPAGALSRFA